MPKKAAAKSRPALVAQRAKLVEEFAALNQEVEEFKSKLQRHKKLRELILGWCASMPAEEEALVPGIAYDIVVSSKDRIRFVTPEGKEKLFKLWGAKRFISHCNVQLQQLPDPKDEDGKYSAHALSGPRHLRVVERVTAAAPQPTAAA